MDLQEQLKNLFPDHEPLPEEVRPEQEHQLYVQKEPMICKFEKRKGKATTIIEGYEGSDTDFKLLAKEIKTKLSPEDAKKLIDFSSRIYKVKRCAKKGVEAMRELARDQRKLTSESRMEYEEYIYIK